MSTHKYTLGLDFGTNSCRALILDSKTGETTGVGSFQYPSGDHGVITDYKNPLVARQHPKDYIEGLPVMVSGAINEARQTNSEFDPENLIGIGISATSSSILPVDKIGVPLAMKTEFEENINGLVWLWKDHSSTEEAQRITELAEKHRPEYLKQIGGRYSSEWYWSKIAHCYDVAPEVYQAAVSFVEVCDYIPALLAGIENYTEIKRSGCAAGHKALFNKQWGGLPDAEFLSMIHPVLGEFRATQFTEVHNSESIAGTLTKKWAQKLGLREGIPIAVGIVDAHAGGVGAGVKERTLVKIIGTSACDILIHPSQDDPAYIPGVSGVVKDSVIQGFYGIEAGQPAAGDLLLWFIENFVPEKYGETIEEKFENLSRQANELKPGESGLVALDWNNGNRSILDNDNLSGLLVGHTLQTSVVDVYRGLLESICFGSRMILEHLETYDITIDSVIACGGFAHNNPLILSILSSVIQRPVHIIGEQETSAFGAALYGTVISGHFDTIQDAQNQFCRIEQTFHPKEKYSVIYNKLFVLYGKLHDSFGGVDSSIQLKDIMKELGKVNFTISNQKSN